MSESILPNKFAEKHYNDCIVRELDTGVQTSSITVRTEILYTQSSLIVWQITIEIKLAGKRSMSISLYFLCENTRTIITKLGAHSQGSNRLVLD